MAKHVPSVMPAHSVRVAAALIAGLLSLQTICCGSEHTAPPSITAFLQQSCADCHADGASEGGFSLSDVLDRPLDSDSVQNRWVRIHDRVESGEMPPADASELTQTSRNTFTREISQILTSLQKQEAASHGRVRARRLTRREFERTLHAVLGIDIPLKNLLPEDSDNSLFSTEAATQDMSHFRMEGYLRAIDAALDEAFHRAEFGHDDTIRELTPRQIARTDPRRRCREPEMREGLAVVWNSGPIFYGRLPVTTAKEDGWYRFRLTVSGLKLPKSGGVWSTVRTGPCVSSAPLLEWVTSFEATEEPKEIEFTAWLPRGHMLEVRPGDAELKRGRFAGGQVAAGEGEPQNLPGIAFHKLTMQRVRIGVPDSETEQLIFGSVPKEIRSSRLEENSRLTQLAAELTETFAARAFRRIPPKEQVALYAAIATEALNEGETFSSALRRAYRAVLCSPRFIYFTESPGLLDGEAIAVRLAYFLTGAPPDTELAQAARSGELNSIDALRHHAERLLKKDDARRFAVDFADEWLDLDQIDFTRPDRRLFPDYDDIVQHSMLEETRRFVQEMLRRNQSVTALIDADATWLDSRLARYYGIDGVDGDALREVPFSAADSRGGLITQGAVLKVTANGTTTSPVVRGVWVSKRLLGVEIPPPPSSVPAIEPDIRGTTTIREMLAKHRDSAECAACHVRIDPPGFVLENFDAAGQWRDRYLVTSGRSRKRGPVIDPSYQLPDGRAFNDLREFQELVCSDPQALARGLTEKLVTYGTGAGISFADREAVDEIVRSAASENYGLRSLVLAVIAHPVFRTK